MDKTELIPFLESIKGKKVRIKNSGYMACQTNIDELNFYIKYNLLTLEDINSKSYVVVPLDRIKEIERKEDNEINIILYIDDQIETEVVIKLKKDERA